MKDHRKPPRSETVGKARTPGNANLNRFCIKVTVHHIQGLKHVLEKYLNEDESTPLRVAITMSSADIWKRGEDMIKHDCSNGKLSMKRSILEKTQELPLLSRSFLLNDSEEVQWEKSSNAPCQRNNRTIILKKKEERRGHRNGLLRRRMVKISEHVLELDVVVLVGNDKGRLYVGKAELIVHDHSGWRSDLRMLPLKSKNGTKKVNLSCEVKVLSKDEIIQEKQNQRAWAKAYKEQKKQLEVEKLKDERNEKSMLTKSQKPVPITICTEDSASISSSIHNRACAPSNKVKNKPPTEFSKSRKKSDSLKLWINNLRPGSRYTQLSKNVGKEEILKTNTKEKNESVQRSKEANELSSEQDVSELIRFPLKNSTIILPSSSHLEGSIEPMKRSVINIPSERYNQRSIDELDEINSRAVIQSPIENDSTRPSSIMIDPYLTKTNSNQISPSKSNFATSTTLDTDPRNWSECDSSNLDVVWENTEKRGDHNSIESSHNYRNDDFNYDDDGLIYLADKVEDVIEYFGIDGLFGLDDFSCSTLSSSSNSTSSWTLLETAILENICSWSCIYDNKKDTSKLTSTQPELIPAVISSTKSEVDCIRDEDSELSDEFDSLDPYTWKFNIAKDRSLPSSTK